jgi:hypothetical protein
VAAEEQKDETDEKEPGNYIVYSLPLQCWCCYNSKKLARASSQICG